MNKISVFKAPITNVMPYKEVTIEDVYTVIKSNKYKDQTERIRMSDDKEGDNLKKTVLDHVCFSCTCTRRKTDNIISHSGYIAIDIDHLSNVLTERDRILNDLPFTPALVFISPKGKGLKIVLRIDTNKAEHEDYFKAFESFFIHQFNIQIDKACKDIVRACFLCYDPDAIFNSDPTLLDQAFIDTFKESTLETIPIADPVTIMRMCKSWLDKKESFINGNRNRYITKLAGAYNRYGIEREIALNDLLSYEQTDFTRKEITATVDSIYNGKTWYGKAKFEELKPNMLVKQEPREPIPELPIRGLPEFIQNFINTCVDVYGTPRDYWAGSVIAAVALAIGDKLELVTKYRNYPIFWICLTGDVSSGKTQALDLCTKLFSDKDALSISEYTKSLQDYERFLKMSKKERIEAGEPDNVEQPKCFQYILVDATPESMAQVHSINSRGIMYRRDELKGWLDDFGRYNKSGEQSNMLSSWSCIGMTYNRKGSGVINIQKPIIHVFGGFQPELLPTLAKDNRAENGFLSRFCFIYPDYAPKPEYSDAKIQDHTYKEWERFLNDLVQIPSPYELQLSEEAKKAYSAWYDLNREYTNSEKSGYLKGVYGKLDIISLRTAIVIKGMKLILEGDFSEVITGEIMRSAIDITEYFRQTAIKVYRKIFAEGDKGLSNKNVAEYLFNSGKNKSEIADTLNVHRQQVQRWLKNK